MFVIAWLEGWDKRRIKFTVDKDKIDDADLTWFRVIVTLSSTQMEKVFDELTSDANRFKIAFTKADGETQLYAEIEKWDTANQKVIIHVSRDGWVISNTEDTIFYMYYDKDHEDNTTYIGILPTLIDAGSEAINRGTSVYGNRTYIVFDNPADFAGKITSVAIYADSDMVSAKVATFYRPDPDNFPAKFTARAVSGNLGAVAAGLQNFTVNLDVVAGDYIGIYFTDSYDYIDVSFGTGIGFAFLAGDQTTCINTTFDIASYTNHTMSLYAKGGIITVGTNVWDSNSKMVQHMVDVNTSKIGDSTLNNNNGTKKGAGEPASATGKVGLAQNFDGVNDYIAISDSADWDFGTGDFTISLLARFTSHITIQTLISNYLNSTTGWTLQRKSDTDKLAFCYGDSILITETFIPNNDQWYYLEVTRIGTSLSLFVDGTQLGDSVNNSTNITGSTAVLGIGYLPLGAGLQFFNGIIDEVHVSKGTGRSAGWIKADYNSLFDTLITYGSEETGATILEFSETLSIVDTMATSGTLAKIETLSIVDSWSGLLTFFETLSIADSKSLTGTLNLAETLGIADSATFQCIKTFYETLSIIDTITTSGSLNLAETLSIADSWTVLKTFFETLSIADTVTMGGTLNVSEIISIIDSFIRWIKHPIYTEPTKGQPVYTKPPKPNISWTEPAKSNPIYTKPAKSNPIYTEPTKGQPVYTEPTKEIRLD